MKEFVIHFYFTHTFFVKMCFFTMTIEEDGIYLLKYSWNINARSLRQVATQIQLVYKKVTLCRELSLNTTVWLCSFIIAISISKSIYTYECSYALKWFYRSFCKNCDTRYY